MWSCSAVKWVSAAAYLYPASHSRASSSPSSPSFLTPSSLASSDAHRHAHTVRDEWLLTTRQKRANTQFLGAPRLYKSVFALLKPLYSTHTHTRVQQHLVVRKWAGWTQLISGLEKCPSFNVLTKPNRALTCCDIQNTKKKKPITSGVCLCFHGNWAANQLTGGLNLIDASVFKPNFPSVFPRVLFWLTSSGCVCVFAVCVCVIDWCVGACRRDLTLYREERLVMGLIR